jgi:hypothetical protein
MTGIVHLRKTGRMSRRAVIGGMAGLACGPSLATLAQTPEASPVTRGGTYLADARERLGALLALLPAQAIGGPDPTMELFGWTDLETQFHTHGIIEPAANRERLVAVTRPLAITDDLFQFSMRDDVGEALGFTALEVHQLLVAGGPPDRIKVYAGGVDFPALVPAWEETGYERRSGNHGAYWTLGEEGEMDLDLPAPIGLGGMNNVALLADDIAVFTRDYATLETVLAHGEDGEGVSAADDEDLNAVLDTLPPDTVNVMAFPGATFRADTMVPENPGRDTSVTVEDLLAESNDAAGPMPELRLAVGGVTAGAAHTFEIATPVAGEARPPHAFMAFLTGSEDDARAAAEVAFWRLENMQSVTTGMDYSERFLPVNTVEDAVEGPVMTVEFDAFVTGSGAWTTLVFTRDSWPFAWLAG